MAVIKIRRPKSQWSNPAVPEYYPTWYIKLTVRGKQILRNTGETVKATALTLEGKLRREKNTERWAEVLEVLDGAKLRRTVASIGQILDAYLDPSVKLVDDETAQRNANDLMLVFAYGMDLWTTCTGGMRGIKVGAKVKDEAAIRKLSSSLLNRKLVQDFQRARQGGEELNFRDEARNHGAINSTLRHARDVFSKKSLSEKLNKLSLPDLTGFRGARGLEADDGKMDPISAVLFAKMVKDANKLKEADEELWLCNVVLRQTGMRSAYVKAMRGTWLMKIAGGWWLDVKKRPEEGFALKPKTKSQRIPLSRELAAVLLRRMRQHGKMDHLVGPVMSDNERHLLVKREHNAWVKAIIGGAGENVQGNHRLRDTVASALCTLHGVAVAQEALAHSTPVTTMKHYATLMPEVSPLLRAELKAWERLSGKGNVLPFRPAAAAA